MNYTFTTLDPVIIYIHLVLILPMELDVPNLKQVSYGIPFLRTSTN